MPSCSQLPRLQETPLYGGVGVRGVPDEPFFFNAYLLIVWGGGGLYFVVLFFECCVFYFAFCFFCWGVFVLLGRLFAKGVLTR